MGETRGGPTRSIIALANYLAGQCSLGRAAQDSGLALAEMAALDSPHIPYARYTPQDAERDLAALAISDGAPPPPLNL